MLKSVGDNDKKVIEQLETNLNELHNKLETNQNENNDSKRQLEQVDIFNSNYSNYSKLLLS